MKTRIIKRTHPDGTVLYVIQTKFLWWWRDGGGYWWNRYSKWKTYREAEDNLWRYDGSKPKDEAVCQERASDSDLFAIRFAEYCSNEVIRLPDGSWTYRISGVYHPDLTVPITTYTLLKKFKEGQK